jgi:hypothetical protein
MHIHTHSRSHTDALTLTQWHVCPQIAQLERALASAEHALKTGANSQKYIYYTLPHTTAFHSRTTRTLLSLLHCNCTAIALQALIYYSLFTTLQLYCNCTASAYLLHCNCTAIALQALICYTLLHITAQLHSSYVPFALYLLLLHCRRSPVAIRLTVFALFSISRRGRGEGGGSRRCVANRDSRGYHVRARVC